jgi:RNA polymerase sigma-70 factor (ECF subfamily)
LPTETAIVWSLGSTAKVRDSSPPDLRSLVERAQLEDIGAFTLIVERFQDMAVGYAFAILSDYGLAEDAAQEAFLGAYLDLKDLRNPTAFPAWLRRIILMRCNRLTRRKKLPTVALEMAQDIKSVDASPQDALTSKMLRGEVSRALQELPQAELTAVVLHYLRGYSHREVAEFLDVAVSTVKSRLHRARKRLHEPLFTTLGETIRDRPPSRDRDFTSRVTASVRRATVTDTEGNGFELVAHGSQARKAALAPQDGHGRCPSERSE